MKSFRDKLRSLIRSPQNDKGEVVGMSAAHLQEIIETALCYFDDLDNDPMALSLIVGVVIPLKEIKLMKTQGKVISEITSFDYVGCGDSSLLRYLSPITADRDRWLSINQALRVGTYWVLQAKRYVEDCGGDTDAFALGWNGSMQTRSGMTYNWEQHFLRLEREMSQILRSIGDTSVADEEFENRLSAFSSHVKEERRLAKR